MPISHVLQMIELMPGTGVFLPEFHLINIKRKALKPGSTQLNGLTMARNLMSLLFSKEDLVNATIANNPQSADKKRLNPVVINAIVGRYTFRLFFLR